MDRRSWLWRRKSSDNSGERFSDDQTFVNPSLQSLEVVSKADIKTLEEKSSTALMNISAKEDLVRQHARVAEEAVSGWEKAEKEVFALQQQLDVTLKKNSALDSALKEYVRQLRQSRDEQEQRANDWKTAKTEFESQIKDLQSQLHICKEKVGPRVDHDLQKKLLAVEKENTSLKLGLLSQAEELELRTIERDLSAQAAETASKQHLESVKKLGKLEAECRRLKAVAYKVPRENIQKLDSASSVSVESLADSAKTDVPKLQHIVTEMNQFSRTEKAFKNFNLMDDFLEIEKLAALPDTYSSSGFDKAEVEILIHRTSELEENLEKIESENLELKMALTESQKELKRLKDELMVVERKFAELQTQLTFSRQAADKEVKAANMKTEEAELGIKDLKLKVALLEQDIAKERALFAENISKLEDELSEVKAANNKTQVAESELGKAELEIKNLLAKVVVLEEEIEEEHALSAENRTRSDKIKDQLSKIKNCEAAPQNAAAINKELKIKQDKELSVAASRFVDCQKTIASLGQQLKSLAAMEDFFIDKDKPFDLETVLLQV